MFIGLLRFNFKTTHQPNYYTKFCKINNKTKPIDNTKLKHKFSRTHIVAYVDNFSRYSDRLAHAKID